MLKNLRLKGKFIIALLILLVASSLFSYLILNPIIRRTVLNSDYETLYVKEQIVTDVINADEKLMLQYIENLQTVVPLFSGQEDLVEYLKDYEKNFELSSIAIISEANNVMFSSTNDVYNHPSEIKAINSAKNNQNIVVKTVTEEAVLFTSAGRVSLNNRNYIILLQLAISDNNYLTKIAEETDTTITLFLGDNRAGTSNRDKDGNYLTGKFNNQEILDTVYTQGKEFHGEVEVQGQTFLAVYRPYKTDNNTEKVMFFVGTNVNHVNEISNSILNKVSIAVGFCILASIITVMIFLNILVIKPVNKTIATLEKIVLTDGTIDLSYEFDAKSNDEIGIMENAINKFFDAQRHFIKAVQDTGSQLEKTAEELASSAQQAAGASTQISANINSVRGSVTKQNKALSAVQSVLDSSVGEIQNLDNLIDTQSSGIVESSASIEEMVGNISSVSNSISKMSSEYNILMNITNTAKTRQDDVFHQVNKMAQQSEHLADANNVISQIASQTNLLAMNAAIEAAHAGEAGKGFAVVADEIRKLAENSSLQSKSIKSELDEITSIIVEVVSSTETSRQEFEDITNKVTSTSTLVHEISNAMSEQEEASRQILIALHEMNDSTSHVSSTSKEMSGNIVHVKTESKNLEIIAHTVEGSMEEMNEGILEITKAAQTVSDMAVTTREKIFELDKLINKFKLK